MMVGETTTPATPLAFEQITHPVEARLARGQQFNAYESASRSKDGWIVGVGPVTDFLGIASVASQDVAEWLVDRLRLSASPAPSGQGARQIARDAAADYLTRYESWSADEVQKVRNGHFDHRATPSAFIGLAERLASGQAEDHSSLRYQIRWSRPGDAEELVCSDLTMRVCFARIMGAATSNGGVMVHEIVPMPAAIGRSMAIVAARATEARA